MSAGVALTWPDTHALDAAMLADELAEFGRSIRDGAEPETGAGEGITALRAVLDALAGAEVAWSRA